MPQSSCRGLGNVDRSFVVAHSERNKVRAAYNHAQYLPERRKMMQWWADFLDQLRGGNRATTVSTETQDEL
jgi:hypothetical protein